VEDEKLTALLDRKFSEVNGRFDRLEGNINGRFDRIEGDVNGRFDRIEGDVNGRFDRLEGKVGVQFEQIRGQIQQVAEGVDNVDQKLDRFHIETLDELKDIRSDIRISFTMLGTRITDLENTHS